MASSGDTSSSSSSAVAAAAAAAAAGVASTTTKTTTTLHQDVTQCLASSLAVCYYSRTVHPSALPLPRSRCRLPSSIIIGGDGDADDDRGQNLAQQKQQQVELVALEVHELTYAIEVDHQDHIIRVAFRGSLTQLDWYHDFIFRMVSVRNPLLLVSSSPHPNNNNNNNHHHDHHHPPHHVIRQTSHFGVHLGFRNYLFGGLLPADTTETTVGASSHVTACLVPPRSKKVDTVVTMTCKYERILAHVRRQLERFPTYQVQVCGHSMGGAMATLTAFCLAAEPDGLLRGATGGGGEAPPVLITCVSIASPRIGNGNFVRAVAELEIQKKIRHLRIVNSDDIVTALPDTTMLAFGLAAHWIRQNFFLHAGMCLHMSKEDEDSKNDGKNNTADFFFPKLHPHNHALYDWTHRTKNMAKRVLTLYHLASTNVPQTHHPLEYQARLKRRSVERLLQSHSWDDLYQKYFGHLQR